MMIYPWTLIVKNHPDKQKLIQIVTPKQGQMIHFFRPQFDKISQSL